MTERPPGEEKPPEPMQRRPERGNSSNYFWLVMIVILIGTVTFAVGSHGRRSKKLEYSDFLSRVEEGILNSDNVFSLKLGPSIMSFQDQPPSKDFFASTKTPTVHTYSISILGMRDQKQKDLTDLLDRKKIAYGFTEEPSLSMEAIVLLTLALGVFVILFMVFRPFGGPGAAISFGRSRGRLYAQEDLGVTFQDVAGIDEAVEELREIVEFLRYPAKYQALGGRIPRGVLLVGPPGTGKTMLAKAVSGEAGVPFFGLSGSDFVEMYVGVGAARVRDMFHQAVQRSPAIIFIDELDALGKVRGSGLPGGQDEREQTLNALLVEMDGFSSDQSVIVMAATNRPETLDPALMRPGRFDRHVLVDRPDIKGREAILKVHASRVKMDDNVDLKGLAKMTPGFVGADLANLVNEAALLAARKNKTRVTLPEFEEAVERVVAGLEKQTRIMPEEEKQRVAYHEVGHALVACMLPNVDPVHKVSIIPRGMGALGYTMQRPEEDRQLITRTELLHKICVLLGGIAVEDIIYKENSTGGANDLQRATDLARRMIMEFGMSPRLGRVYYSESTRSPFLAGAGKMNDAVHSEETIREIDLEVRRIIDSAYEMAANVLNARLPVVEQLTRELLEKEVMDAAQIQAILAQNRTGPAINPATFATEVGAKTSHSTTATVSNINEGPAIPPLAAENN